MNPEFLKILEELNKIKNDLSINGSLYTVSELEQVIISARAIKEVAAMNIEYDNFYSEVDSNSMTV